MSDLSKFFAEERVKVNESFTKQVDELGLTGHFTDEKQREFLLSIYHLGWSTGQTMCLQKYVDSLKGMRDRLKSSSTWRTLILSALGGIIGAGLVNLIFLAGGTP